MNVADDQAERRARVARLSVHGMRRHARRLAAPARSAPRNPSRTTFGCREARPPAPAREAPAAAVDPPPRRTIVRRRATRPSRCAHCGCSIRPHELVLVLASDPPPVVHAVQHVRCEDALYAQARSRRAA